jgi:hypothetical protein
MLIWESFWNGDRLNDTQLHFVGSSSSQVFEIRLSFFRWIEPQQCEWEVRCSPSVSMFPGCSLDVLTKFQCSLDVP